jgi:hypothetical protein
MEKLKASEVARRLEWLSKFLTNGEYVPDMPRMREACNYAAAYLRRVEPENKALTNFDRITQSPENLAKFLQDIWDGKIPFDNLYCDECGNCLEGGGCKENADETNCITRWLNQTK